MSKHLPAVKARELIAALKKDGFALAHQKGSHATYKHPDSGKRVTIPIHPGHDLKRPLLQGILNELGWSHEEFLEKL